MKTFLSKLAKLTPADWRELGIAYLYLVLAGWRLFIRKETPSRWLNGGSSPWPGKPLLEEDRQAMTGCAHRVNVAARHPVTWARCLQQSLALCLWLEKRGFQPELEIGVRKKGRGLEAHAWVKYCGEVLNGRADVLEEFTALTAASKGRQEIEIEGERHCP